MILGVGGADYVLMKCRCFPSVVSHRFIYQMFLDDGKVYFYTCGRFLFMIRSSVIYVKK